MTLALISRHEENNFVKRFRDYLNIMQFMPKVSLFAVGVVSLLIQKGRDFRGGLFMVTCTIDTANGSAMLFATTYHPCFNLLRWCKSSRAALSFIVIIGEK